MALETLTGGLPKSKDILRNKSLNNLRTLINNKNHRKQNTLAELEEETYNNNNIITVQPEKHNFGKFNQISKICLLSKD
jgi:hypothetical protein